MKTRHASASWFAALAAGAIIADTTTAQSITRIPPLTEQFWSIGAERLSQDGSVVAGYAGPGFTRAVRWAHPEPPQDLGALAPDSSNRAHGISADGTVLVGSSGNRATRWTRQGGLQNLGTLPGGGTGFSTSEGVSADGSTLVGTSSTPDQWASAFIWTQAGGMREVPRLPRNQRAAGVAISADGLTVLAQNFFPGFDQAYIWTNIQGVRPIPPLSSEQFALSTAEDLSADGTTAVGSEAVLIGERYFMRPWVWNASRGTRDLGTIVGSSEASAGGINADGSIAVGYCLTNDPVFTALIWTNVNTTAPAVFDLNLYLPTLGLDLTGWRLDVATAISADGNVISGYGFFNNERAGWIVHLTDICSADYDRNGTLDFADYLTFVNDWTQELPAADFNRDGTMDFFDYLDFVAAFDAGCN